VVHTSTRARRAAWIASMGEGSRAEIPALTPSVNLGRIAAEELGGRLRISPLSRRGHVPSVENRAMFARGDSFRRSRSRQWKTLEQRGFPASIQSVNHPSKRPQNAPRPRNRGDDSNPVPVVVKAARHDCRVPRAGISRITSYGRFAVESANPIERIAMPRAPPA
jgi:hypothetical protein